MTEKTLTFRITQPYDGDNDEGKIWLSTEPAERPYPVTREQAEECARENEARFVERER